MAENQLACQACGKAFSSKAELDQHNKQVHATTEKAQWASTQQAIDGVNCPVCGAQFTTTDQLERHARLEHQQND